MAKDAHDREDLLRDATGMPERIELQVLWKQQSGEHKAEVQEQTVFCGFRDSDAFSLYWGQETVLQFNVMRELRRGFWQERMVASYKRQLHWLQSDSSTGRLRLTRTAFSNPEHDQFVALAAGYVDLLRAALSNGDAKTTGQFPSDANLLGKVKAYLQNLDVTTLAVHPGVGRK